MKTILIAGGAGFIGSNLCEKLINMNHNIICLDNLLTGNMKNIEHLLDKPNFTFINHDIIESTLYTISKTYPLLNQRKTNYGIIISKNKLDDGYDDEDDPYHNHKLGKLLGYPTYDQYPISRKDKENGYYTFHIKVKLIKKNMITLFSFVASDLSSENKIYDILTHIKETLFDSEYSMYIKRIYIERLKKRDNKIIELKFIY